MGSKSSDAQHARDAWVRYHGKPVPKGMIVHHKNGDPTDDSRGNLMLLTIAQHNILTKKGKSWAQWKYETKDKPNIEGNEKPQRRYR